MRTRNRIVMCRLTDDELEHLKMLVEKSGRSQESYLRSIMKGIVPADKPPPDYLSFVAELSSIGNNLNQIAAKAHTLGVIDAARYDECARELSRALAEIDKVVKAPRKL